MDFSKKDNYTIEDIKSLISNEVEENVHLDYKAAAALEKNDKKRTEITKDVSAFANSDGGIIIYGVSEEDHKPKEVSSIDGRIYTKEWLENVIQLIQPRIEDIRILPIRAGDIGQTLYVVKIPRSSNAPHMANDRRYYKRYNFMSVPMEDYEVKDLYNRNVTPDLDVSGCSFYKERETDSGVTYRLVADITNFGNNVCETYKLNFYINKSSLCEIYTPNEGQRLSTTITEDRLKITSPSREPIYPKEKLSMGYFDFLVNRSDESDFIEGLVIDMVLFYPGGKRDVAYIPLTQKFIEGREEIDKVLKQKCKK